MTRYISFHIYTKACIVLEAMNSIKAGLEMVNQSLRNRDKVKDDAIVDSMDVIKWWCYNEGHRYNSYCSPSANYYGDWMEMNAIYECQNIHGRRC
jgi:hypothetical protein